MTKESESQSQPLSQDFLLERGTCCGNGCFNCPYITVTGEKHVKGTVTINLNYQKPVEEPKQIACHCDQDSH